ncbi:MAG: HAMP domain-containing protein [Propionibacteriales bacterium]|nr:HAMP domain-containing protein [Propionibacteriales bacterium]
MATGSGCRTREPGLTVLDRMRSSVRLRVTVVASVFVLLVTAVGSVVVVAMLAHSISHSLVDSAREDAAAIHAQLRNGVTPAEAATTGRGDVVVQLLDARGQVIASDRPERLTVPLRTTAGVTESAAVPGLSDTFTLVARRSKDTGDVALIIVGRSTEQRDETRAESAGLLAITVPLIAVALAVIVWLSVGRALKPVEVMREEADAITTTRLRRRLAVPPGHDEVPRLAQTLNEMLDRIDEGQRLQRQFVSDASHELRSPLAAIRQSADVARMHPDQVDVATLAGDVLAESERLGDLVGALLLLARLEGDEIGVGGVLDLDDVVLTEVARAHERWDVRIDATGVGAGRTSGSTVLLGQVVRNLLDNACRHAASTVTVALRELDDVVELEVSDDGSGISVADRGRVFERFVRLDEARARDEGGSGLGLAIVRKIVETSHGSVDVGESATGGALFVVRLPRVAD